MFLCFYTMRFVLELSLKDYRLQTRFRLANDWRRPFKMRQGAISTTLLHLNWPENRYKLTLQHVQTNSIAGSSVGFPGAAAEDEPIFFTNVSLPACSSSDSTQSHCGPKGGWASNPRTATRSRTTRYGLIPLLSGGGRRKLYYDLYLTNILQTFGLPGTI